jgi:hypothetical protein
MNNFNNFLNHLNLFSKKKASSVSNNLSAMQQNANKSIVGAPNYNYQDTMVGSVSEPAVTSTPAQSKMTLPPKNTLMASTVPARALPTATGTALQMGQKAAEMKGADSWNRSRAGTFDYGTETLPSANYDPVVVQAREELEKSKKFREEHDARAAVDTTNRNKVRDDHAAEQQRMRNSPNQWERDLQAKIDEKRAQDDQGAAHQDRVKRVEDLNASLPENEKNPNNTTPTDSRPRDAMGKLLEANNITNFKDHMKFLSYYSKILQEDDTSYDNVESTRIRSMDQNTTSLPKDEETIKNLDKAWDYRKSWLAKGTIKDAWGKMTPMQQQQARNYAQSKGRDFKEMDSALNETSSHNILLNYLNSFVK